jgi:hypothetical protein
MTMNHSSGSVPTSDRLSATLFHRALIPQSSLHSIIYEITPKDLGLILVNSFWKIVIFHEKDISLPVFFSRKRKKKCFHCNTGTAKATITRFTEGKVVERGGGTEWEGGGKGRGYRVGGWWSAVQKSSTNIVLDKANKCAGFNSTLSPSAARGIVSWAG